MFGSNLKPLILVPCLLPKSATVTRPSESLDIRACCLLTCETALSAIHRHLPHTAGLHTKAHKQHMSST